MMATCLISLHIICSIDTGQIYMTRWAWHGFWSWTVHGQSGECMNIMVVWTTVTWNLFVVFHGLSHAVTVWVIVACPMPCRCFTSCVHWQRTVKAPWSPIRARTMKYKCSPVAALSETRVWVWPTLVGSDLNFTFWAGLISEPRFISEPAFPNLTKSEPAFPNKLKIWTWISEPA